MNLIKRNEGHVPAFQRLFFDDVFGRDLFNWENNNFSTASTTLPSVNSKETDQNYEVEVAAPGMSRDDFKVTLDDGQLLISSFKQQHVNKEEENYTRRGLSCQSFQRSFMLPKNAVDQDRIRARYENGILLLSIPKLEQAREKSPRMIEIS